MRPPSPGAVIRCQSCEKHSDGVRPCGRAVALLPARAEVASDARLKPVAAHQAIVRGDDETLWRVALSADSHLVNDRRRCCSPLGYAARPATFGSHVACPEAAASNNRRCQLPSHVDTRY